MEHAKRKRLDAVDLSSTPSFPQTAKPIAFQRAQLQKIRSIGSQSDLSTVAMSFQHT